MKKLYFLDEAEKNRILNLHESATKNQYLINEVGYGSGNWVDVNYQNRTLKLNNYLEMENDQGGDELKLNAGVVFTVKDSKTLIAKNVPFQIVGDFTGSVSEKGNGTVEYYCSRKRFKILGRQLTYWGEDFQSNVQKAFDDLCGEAASVTPNKPAANNVNMDANKAWFKFPCVPLTQGGKPLTLADGSAAFQIGSEFYYNNGRVKLANGTMGNYYCENNKIKKGSKSSSNQKNKSQQNKQKSNVVNYADYGL